MNEKEDYFRISKKGHVHILSDRIPLNWKEVLLIPISTFIAIVLLFGNWLIGLVIGLLTAVGYTLYRFGAWVYYSETQIDEKNGKMTRLKKIFNRTHEVNLITDKFDPSRLEYLELNRSGKNKFLMTYRTHKNHDLLILKNSTDKNLVENYIKKEVNCLQHDICDHSS